MAAAPESSNMVEQEVTITNKLGLHARASAKLVQLLQGYKSNAWIIHRGREINAKSIMGVMMLAAGIGQTVVLRTDGPDETAALAAMAELFARKFDEGA
jgi:phosphocarrier protein